MKGPGERNTTIQPALCLSQAQAGYNCISSIENLNKSCHEEKGDLKLS